MKWMIASDIHGSAFYCRKLLERFGGESADRLLLLGDLLYHGPRNDLPKEYDPKTVIDLLNGVKERVLCVRGNCDTEVDQMVLAFPILADYALIDLGDRLIYATHGHRWNEDCLPPLQKGDILLYGHTHIPVCRPGGDCICMNPGSVSIPKGQSGHGYMVLEDRCFLWKDLEGNIQSRFVL